VVPISGNHLGEPQMCPALRHDQWKSGADCAYQAVPPADQQFENADGWVAESTRQSGDRIRAMEKPQKSSALRGCKKITRPAELNFDPSTEPSISGLRLAAFKQEIGRY